MKKMKSTAIILAAVMIAASVFLTACGESGNSGSTTSADSSAASESSAGSITESKGESGGVSTVSDAKEDNSAASESSAGSSKDESSATEESNIKIVSHSLGKDYEGKDVLVIEYAFTNTDDKAKSFNSSCQDSVFQNGIECTSTVIGCDEVDIQQQLNNVQPGVTYNLKVGYVLEDKSPANVVVKDLFGQKTILDAKISIDN